MKGEYCPHCGNATYHNRGSYRECSQCGYLGWPALQPIVGVGSGTGRTCPWCAQLTLHDVKVLDNGATLRRCSICNYTAIEPT